MRRFEEKAVRSWVAWFVLTLVTSTNPLWADQGEFAFVHASVVPMNDERVLPDQTVIIRDGRIDEIGPASSVSLPEGMTQIDASGRYLLPAFCDMHVHLLGETWAMVLPAETRVTGEALDLRPFLLPYLINGVTTVQALSATPDHLALRERIRAGEVVGPRLVLARMIDAPERAWPPPLSSWVGTPEEAREAVLQAAEAGYDAMKVYSFLDQAAYDAIVDTADEAGLDLIGHIPMSLSLDYVVDAGQRLIAHSEEVMKHAAGDYSSERIELMAGTLASNGTWLTPTLVTSRNVIALFDDLEGEMARPELQYFQHPIQRGVWSFIIQNLYQPTPEEQRQFVREGFERFQRPFTAALHQQGGRLLAGTDSGVPVLVPGFSLHRELEELVEVGLTPYEALRTSTTSPFEYLGESAEAGTIEVGKRAELVLLDANPLVDISNSSKVAGVVVRGRWLSRQELLDGLRAGDAVANDG